MMPPQRYSITYHVERHNPPLTADEVHARAEERGQALGACDAIALFSMLYPPDGSYSQLLVTRDGRADEELSDEELWKVWTLFAARLTESQTLGRAKRQLCHRVLEQVREMMGVGQGKTQP